MPAPPPLDIPPNPQFQALDWVVLCGYFAVLLITGILFARRTPKTSDQYFLGGRKMPIWAVAISIVATSLSAATFIGTPEESYRGDLTYLATNIGMILAALTIAIVFIPAFYKSRSESIYHLLELRFGPTARKAASVTFLLGRILASGARIYIGALPAAILLFGLDKGEDPASIIVAIAALTVVGIIYTLAGGISSVIWSDVIQYIILVGAALCAIVLITNSFNAPASEIITQLSTGNDGASKLTLFDTSLDPTHRYTIPACIIGFTLLGIGSYGTDQDLAQRLLTCKSAAHSARSILTGILLGIPTVATFLTVGLLLWIVYQRPDLTTLGPQDPPNGSATIFLHYILTQIPSGVRGLMMAGLFAAGLSSLNSAINSMGAAFISDLYRPFIQTRRKEPVSDRHFVVVGRIAVVVWGVILGAFAVICIYWKQAQGDTLIGFALGVMTFAYSGLIGVFFTAIFTKRGSTASVLAALVVGFAWMLLNQQFVYNMLDPWHSPKIDYFYSIHFTWKLTVGVALSMLICMMGKRQLTD